MNDLVRDKVSARLNSMPQQGIVRSCKLFSLKSDLYVRFFIVFKDFGTEILEEMRHCIKTIAKI